MRIRERIQDRLESRFPVASKIAKAVAEKAKDRDGDGSKMAKIDVYRAMGAAISADQKELEKYATDTEMDDGERAAMMQYYSLMVKSDQEALEVMTSNDRENQKKGFDGADANLR